ncbi:hypothetical protein Tco_1543608, partial [Tanacetum coccineum]
MEPQLGLYVRLGEILGLRFPTIGIRARLGPMVVWMVFPRLDPGSTVLVDPGKPCTKRKSVKGGVFRWFDQEEVFVVWFFWKEHEGYILFGLPGSRQQKFLVLRFFDVKEQQGID